MSIIDIVDGAGGVKPSGFYVYLHRRITDGLVMHVGKGNRRRAWSRSGRNQYWRNTGVKHGILVEIYKDGLSEKCALTLEKIAIFHYKSLGHPLTNLTYGGGGITGWRHTDETKAAISKKGKGRKPTEKQLIALRSNDGKPISESAKVKMSAAKIGISRGPMPDHIRAKISASHMGIRPSPEALEKMRASKIGLQRREQIGTFDPQLRIFRHKDGEEFIGVQYDFRMKYGLLPSCVCSIINRNAKTTKGWTYVGIFDSMQHALMEVKE